MSTSIQELHAKINISVSKVRKAEAELLELLTEMDQRRGYYEMGYASLYEYCVQGLKFSESQASAFISVGRKAAEVPLLKEAIRSGELSISKAKRITRVIQASNAKDWLDKVKAFSQREIELEVARISPQNFVSEKYEQMTEKICRLTIAMKAETYEKLEAAKDLLETGNLESTLEEVLNFFLERKDPLLKAKRAEKNIQRNSSPRKALALPKAAEHSSRNVSRRVPIPASLRHQIQLRDDGHCQYRYPDGRQCHTRRYLHLHHRIPISQNGKNILENMEVLCSRHHKLHHFLENSQISMSIAWQPKPWQTRNSEPNPRDLAGNFSLARSS